MKIMDQESIKKITDEITEILLKKNQDYGGASFDLGLNGNMVHLWDKVRRYRSLIEKNKEKAQKKKEKRGEKAEKINAMAQTNTKSIKSSATKSSSMSDIEREEKLEKARANAKPGSLASKANMVKNFNENK